MPKSRGQNEGNIKKRSDGRWEARISLEDGTRRSYYGTTRQEVAQLLNKALRDKEQGVLIKDEQQTVEAYFLSWLESIKHTVKPRTVKNYRDYARLHIIPVLGKVKLAKLSPQQVQNFYTKKLDEGLSSTTVHHLHAVLHKALNNAIRLGLVHRNVTDMVDAPRMRRIEMQTLSEAEVQRFLAAARDTRFEALYIVALSTGMRQGELLALRWRYVDLGRAVLQVRGTLQYLSGKLSIADPKTAGSRRSVRLSKRAVDALRQHQAKQEELARLLGDEWEGDLDLVFPNTKGKLQAPFIFCSAIFIRCWKRPDYRTYAFMICGILLPRYYFDVGSM
jgi:integrase